jgi:hypothetical protein
VTKGSEREVEGQAAQTDAQELVHRERGVPVVVIDMNGRIFSPDPTGGWSQVGGPVK